LELIPAFLSIFFATVIPTKEESSLWQKRMPLQSGLGVCPGWRQVFYIWLCKAETFSPAVVVFSTLPARKVAKELSGHESSLKI
jgi:hypothetical protein